MAGTIAHTSAELSTELSTELSAKTAAFEALLARRVQQGFITLADAYEVEHTLELLLDRLREGSITLHFALTVIDKLADEKCRDWLERTERL